MKGNGQSKTWVRARAIRARWMEGKLCARCGATSDLQVHHIDRRTKVDHKVWTWRASRREAELAKCVVLCRACHVLTHEPDHGTVSRYTSDKHRCRCEACRAAKASNRKRWKALRVAEQITLTVRPRRRKSPRGQLSLFNEAS